MFNDEIVTKFPHLMKRSKYTIFTSLSDVILFKSGEKIFVKGHFVSTMFLNKLLSCDDYYKFACSFFKNEVNYLSVAAVENGNANASVSYGKVTIIEGIQQCIKSNKMTLTPELAKRYNYLKSFITWEEFSRSHENEIFKVEIDGKNYQISVMAIMRFLQIPSAKLEDVYNGKINELGAMSREHFLYAILKYFESQNLVNNYFLPETILQNYSKIKDPNIVDLQSINQFVETEDKLYKKVVLNEELENAIIGDMPSDLNTLEKAIYIYIKMCKTLTYDEEYAASKEKEEVLNKHRNIGTISNITPSNNRVVCFEFNIIYSAFLHKLGVNFKSNYFNEKREAYGKAHVELHFRCGKFLIVADSVNSILSGDLTLAKINKTLKGLRCININEETRCEFEDAVFRMQKLIMRQEKQLSEVEFSNHFIELLQEYSVNTSNIKNISLEKRFSILLEKVKKSNLVGVDSLSYILLLKKALFSAKEVQDNFSFTVVRNNDTQDSNRLGEMIAIFIVNSNGYCGENGSVYYRFNPMNNSLENISLEYLQDMFDNKVFEYLNLGSPLIPGVKGGIKK